MEYSQSFSRKSSFHFKNTYDNIQVWKVIFEEVVTSFSLDPFTNTSAVLPSESGWIFVVTDFNVKTTPEQISKKLQVGASPSKTNGPPQTTLRDFTYSPHTRNHLHLIARREVTMYVSIISSPNY
jgi:hypothetical protein